MTKVRKNIVIYANPTSEEMRKELRYIFEQYNSSRNFFYGNYYSNSQYLKILNYKKEIRNPLTQNKALNQWNIPNRYSRMALEQVASEYKSMYSNLKNKLKEIVRKTKSLTDLEKKEAYTILKSKAKYQTFVTEYLDYKDCSTKVRNFLARELRENKPNVSRAKALTMNLEEQMYSIKNKHIFIMGLIPRKLLKYKLNSEYVAKGNITIQLLANGKIRINRCQEVNYKDFSFINDNPIGVDKNYINAIETSTGNSYGVGLNALQDAFTTAISQKTKTRNLLKTIRVRISENPLLSKREKDRKLNNISIHNASTIKVDAKINRTKEEIRKLINKGIKEFIKAEKPSLIVKEDLTWSRRSKKQRGKYSKVVNNKLSNWVNGYLNERIEYIAATQGVATKDINAAHTSQTCSECFSEGIRHNDVFYCGDTSCIHNKGVKSGINAARNVLKLKDFDKYVTLRSLQERCGDSKEPTTARPLEGANREDNLSSRHGNVN